MDKNLTREELFLLVWQRPSQEIARELGISDVALGKRCKKLQVPKPPPGYWVFIVPGAVVKNREDRLVVLNRVAASVIEQVRGNHPEHVFTYKGKPVQTINNSGWKRARKKVCLTQVRVHDLKHTFGGRLRAATVSLETRKVLLGHRNGDITTRYSAPELEELLEAANKVCEEKSGTGYAETKNG